MEMESTDAGRLQNNNCWVASFQKALGYTNDIAILFMDLWF
jgi:hypothetical protein